MKLSFPRLGSLVCAAAFTLAIPGQVLAAPSPIAKVMGNLRWGMNDLEVRSALKGKTDEKKLEASRVDLDGGRVRTDGTIVGEEYTHGNGESMLSFKDGDSENYLFFVGGELWKWVKVYPASAFRGGFASSVKKRFGKGYDKTGEVNPGSGASYDYVEFVDRETRLRAVDKSSEYRAYVLMFESMSTARSIASMRTSTIRRGTPAKKAAVAAKPSRSDDEEEAPVAKSSRGGSAPGPLASASASSGKERKSLFSDESQQGETDEEYKARKARMQADARDAEKRQHARKQDAKKGKILDELAGIDDEDPISGMK